MIEEESILGYAPITSHKIGQTMSLSELCEAAMFVSDNTAANLLLKELGGPSTITVFMKILGDNTTRLDRWEPELNEATVNDIRDTTTANAMTESLYSVLFQEHLSELSRQQLQYWLINNKVTGSLLRSVIPQSWSIGDRSGAGGSGSRGITAVIFPDNQPAVFVAIYITQTKASMAQRDRAIAEIGEVIFTLIKNNNSNHNQ
ncbi:class A beta-lactamase [Psychromonas sp. RZ22]|uniref:class A beta-lactamase n=1 Tax=Psychromonas algarum TaxID=2555643 RepID=UPI0010678719|nr:class A beta-lactamase [Psychromonas sp. RZ22]TEW56608.1 class A beta-lactamase [Psychromonas sp. RZ22]